MNRKCFLRWLAVVVAVPAGGFAGACGGLKLGFFAGPAEGATDDDVFFLLGAGGLGLIFGMVLLPICVLYLTHPRH